jgi:hypothetical protein
MQGGPRQPREPLSLELTPEQRQAIETLAGDRKVKLDGRIEHGRLRIVGIQILPIGACNTSFDPVGQD